MGLSDVRPISIGARLKKFSQINTLGFRPNFQDYSPEERQLIRDAEIIYYPTAFYAQLFYIMGKKTFPSFHCYHFTLDKINQTALFELQNIPHPKTRVFYGKKQAGRIAEQFSFPFVAKRARGSARGEHVYLIRTEKDLASYLESDSPAYIQEYLPIEKDIRIIIIGSKIRLAYWRIPKENSFLTNISRGGRISFEAVPQKALDLALKTAKKCCWDDVGLDIVFSNNRYYVLEGNMKYGTKGFKAAGIDYKKFLLELILNKEI